MAYISLVPHLWREGLVTNVEFLRPGSHTRYGIRDPDSGWSEGQMLHNANHKLIDQAALEVMIPRLSVGLPAKVVSDAIVGAFQQLGYSNPTARGCDIFVSLPTCEGKSLCYATLPFVFDVLRRYLQSHREQQFARGCIALVVSPLLALMKDQVDTFERRGLKCTYVGRDSCQLAFVYGPNRSNSVCTKDTV